MILLDENKLKDINTRLDELYTDFLLLEDGSWVPDTDSIDASIANLEGIKKYVSGDPLLKDLRGMYEVPDV